MISNNRKVKRIVAEVQDWTAKRNSRKKKMGRYGNILSEYKEIGTNCVTYNLSEGGW